MPIPVERHTARIFDRNFAAHFARACIDEQQFVLANERTDDLAVVYRNAGQHIATVAAIESFQFFWSLAARGIFVERRIVAQLQFKNGPVLQVG